MSPLNDYGHGGARYNALKTSWGEIHKLSREVSVSSWPLVKISSSFNERAILSEISMKEPSYQKFLSEKQRCVCQTHCMPSKNYLTIFILITTALTNISFMIAEEVSHAKKYILNPP